MRNSRKNPPQRGTTRNKLLWSLAALGAAGAMAGLGTFATFTATTAEQSGLIDTGHVALTLGNAGSLAVNDIVPGDQIQRLVDLTNVGDNLDTVTLVVTTNPTSGTEPYEDPSRVMTLAIDRCESPNTWEASGTSYVCQDAGLNTVAATAVLGSEALLGAHGLPGLTALAGTAHLRLTLSFSDIAGDNYQQQSTTLGYTFLGVQRPDAAQ